MSNGLTETTLSDAAIKHHGPAAQCFRRAATILSGQDLAAGTVVGKHTTSGKYKAYASGNSDGSQNPVGVIQDKVDATAGDVDAWIFLRGNFLTSDLTGMDATALTALKARAAMEFTILP